MPANASPNKSLAACVLRLVRIIKTATNKVSNVSGGKYLAVFNAGEEKDLPIRVEWKDLGLSGAHRVRDLWSHQGLGKFPDAHALRLAPHASALYLVR